MKKNLPKLVAVVLAVGLIVAATATAEEPPSEVVAPEEASNANDWKFAWELYGLLPDIKAHTASGGELDITLHDILENLDLALFSAFGAFKGKWGVVLDVIYMDLHADDSGTITIPLKGDIGIQDTVGVDVGMRAWVLTPSVRYNLIDNEKINLSLLAGARYLWIETKLDLKKADRFKYSQHKFSGSEDVWDGVVGVRGHVPLTDKWYIPYYFDIGAGDSQLTWQAFGGIGYRFKYCDLVAGYRHLDWNFDDGAVLGDLTVSGLNIGAIFRF